jgi:hypothetical protein
MEAFMDMENDPDLAADEILSADADGLIAAWTLEEADELGAVRLAADERSE